MIAQHSIDVVVKDTGGKVWCQRVRGYLISLHSMRFTLLRGQGSDGLKCPLGLAI